MAYAGLDVGTSGCKLLVYELDGSLIYRSVRRYQESGEKGYRELDPSLVLRNVKSVLKEAGEQCPAEIDAIAVASLGESVVLLDASDNPLCKSALTGDSRGISQTERLIEKYGRRRIFEITGLPPNELYGLPKYMWINEHTDAVRHADKVFFYEDYIGYYLTGERKVSYSSAARSLAFDITKKKWSDQLLAEAGITAEVMSEPCPSGTLIGIINPSISEELHLPRNMKVVVGGHDQSCAAYGSGLNSMDVGECGMGTCEFSFMMLPGPVMNQKVIDGDFTCIPYILPNTYLTSIEIPTCGILKNWARDQLFEGIRQRCEQKGENFFSYMDQRAAETDTDVLVLPQFGSSGNPDLSMDARGTITGLTIHTQPEEIYRAIIEGMAFQSYMAYEETQDFGVDTHAFVCTGGGAASTLGLQIRADVFNREMYTLQTEESGTLGCMMLAAIGAGAYQSYDEAITSCVKRKAAYLPDPGRHAAYMEKYERYKKLYHLMHEGV